MQTRSRETFTKSYFESLRRWTDSSQDSSRRGNELRFIWILAKSIWRNWTIKSANQISIDRIGKASKRKTKAWREYLTLEIAERGTRNRKIECQNYKRTLHERDHAT